MPKNKFVASPRQQLVRRALIAACATFLVLFAVFTVWRAVSKQALTQRSKQSVVEAAARAASVIENHLDELRVVDAIVTEITERNLGDEEIDALLLSQLKTNAEISSLTVAYTGSLGSPADPAPPRSISYIRFEADDQIQRMPDNRLDTDADWFRNPLKAGKGVWSDAAYYSGFSRVWWSGGYGAPFFRADESGTVPDEPTGIISADLTLQQVRLNVLSVVAEHLTDLPLEASYAFIVSSGGAIISHSDNKIVEAGKTIADFAPTLTGANAIENLPRVSADLPVRLLDDIAYPRSGQRFLALFAPVTNAGLWVVIVLDENEIENQDRIVQRLRNLEIAALLSAVFGIFVLTCLVCPKYCGRLVGYWIVSGAFSVLCVAAIVYLWSSHVIRDSGKHGDDIMLVNDAIAAKVRLLYGGRGGRELVRVPTGVFVQSIKFSGTNDVTMTGYIWQKYAESIPRRLKPTESSPGFVFPESEEIEIQPAYRKRQKNGEEVWGWYFTTTLRLKFDFSRYPFDNVDVWIRMWHRNLGEGVMLSPDLGAYSTILPADLPGVEHEDFALEGWRMTKAYFSYRLNSYNANFGFDDHAGQHDFPELYYHIGMERVFILPFIANLLPLGVVALLLFAILMTVRGRSEGGELHGFSSNNVLSFCAALFFVVIVSHISLRERLYAPGVIYLEHFYFVTYTAILVISVNALIIALPNPPRALRYEDNLVVRLLFWPVFLGSLLAITVLSFR